MVFQLRGLPPPIDFDSIGADLPPYTPEERDNEGIPSSVRVHLQSPTDVSDFFRSRALLGAGKFDAQVVLRDLARAEAIDGQLPLSTTTLQHRRRAAHQMQQALQRLDIPSALKGILSGRLEAYQAQTLRLGL